MAVPQLFLLPLHISHSDWLLARARASNISPAAIFTNLPPLDKEIRHDVIARAQLISSQTQSAFLLPNLDTASIVVQDILLKILEEPPAHIHFFLSTSDLTKVLPTIKSRVHIFSPKIDSPKKIDIALISAWQLSRLKEKVAGEIIADSEKLLAALIPFVDDGVEDKKTVLERRALHLLLPELLDLYRADLAAASLSSSSIPPALTIAALAFVQRSYQYLLANVSPKLILSDLFLQISALFGKINPNEKN